MPIPNFYTKEEKRNGKEEKHFSKINIKSKAVPLHAMEAHGGRGGIAPTHT
jgi:hypothetical protein